MVHFFLATFPLFSAESEKKVQDSFATQKLWPFPFSLLFFCGTEQNTPWFLYNYGIFDNFNFVFYFLSTFPINPTSLGVFLSCRANCPLVRINDLPQKFEDERGGALFGGGIPFYSSEERGFRYPGIWKNYFCVLFSAQVEILE